VKTNGNFCKLRCVLNHKTLARDRWMERYKAGKSKTRKEGDEVEKEGTEVNFDVAVPGKNIGSGAQMRFCRDRKNRVKKQNR